MVGIVTSTNSLERDTKNFPNVVVSDNLKSAIERLQPDAVIISSPNHTHLKYLKVCASYQLPVLLEKPALLNTSEFREFEKEFGSDFGKNKVLVGHHRVHSSQLTTAVDILETGVIGTPTAFLGRAAFYKPEEYFQIAKWRTEKPGGGPILINFIHEIQSMRILMGEIINVTGMTSSFPRKFEVENTAAISLQFASGALGTFLLCDTSVSPFSWELTSGENPDYPNNPDESCYEVYGTKGTLTIPNLNLFTQNVNDRSWWNKINITKLDTQKNDPLCDQFSHFENVIKQEVNPKVSLEDGIINVSILEKIMSALK